MDPEPQRPREEAPDADARRQLGHRRGPADRRQVALVLVLERADVLRRAGVPGRAWPRSAPSASPPAPRRAAGRRRGPGPCRRSRAPRGARAARGPARPAAVRPGRSRRLTPRPGSDETPAASTPAAQMIVSPELIVLVAASSTPSASMSVTVWLSIGVTPRFSSECVARLESFGGNAASTRSPASTSRTRVCRGVDVAEVLARVAGDLGDLARHLDAGRAGADDHERQQPRRAPPRRRPPRRPRTPAGSARGCAARPRATSARRRAPATRGGRSSCTSSRRRRSACRSRASPRRPPCAARRVRRVEIEPGRLGEHHAHALLAAEDRPQRVADLARGQRAGRDLVGRAAGRDGSCDGRRA